MATNSLIFVVLLLTAVVSSQSQEIPEFNSVTEFVEPLKNITAAVGTNVDFICSVRNLGPNSRVSWLREGRHKDILAINTLLITRNHKMSVSLMGSSDLVTNSILYIYNVGPEEAGIYSCSVNTDPIISQKGTLEVFTKPTLLKPDSTTTTKPEPDFVFPKSQEESGTIFCVDISKLWRDTKKETGDFVQNVWNKVSNLFSKYQD